VLEDTETVAVVAAGLAALALVICLVLAARIGRLHRAYNALVAGDSRATFVDSVRRQAAAVEALRTDVATLRTDLSAARVDLSDALRHVAVVRYDAFGDMGGRMSFSAALLDDAGDGLVLTSINGRSETRTYAKGVRGGASDHTMSPEEKEAIAYASRGEKQPGDDVDLTASARRLSRPSRPGRSGRT
jgi:HAMP domain-containing protein